MTPVRLVATLLRTPTCLISTFLLILSGMARAQGAAPGAPLNLTGGASGTTVQPDVAGAGHRGCRQFVSPRSRCITQRPSHRLAFSARKFGGRAKRTQRHLLRSGARRERRGHRCAIERSRRDGPGRRWAATRLWARLPFTAEPSAEPLWQRTRQCCLVDMGSPAVGCPATAYLVQAGSARGLTDVAQVNVGSQVSLAASAPSGVYFVRVVGVECVWEQSFLE